MKQIVLVTGCAGYIGSLLCQELLSNGYKVIGIDSLIYNNGMSMAGFLGHHNFEFVYGTVADTDLISREVKRADTIVPLAAIVGAPACELYPMSAQVANHTAIKTMIEHLSPNQRIVFPNTNSGYGATTGNEECTEESPMNPISLYGKTKCEAEKVVLDHPRSVVLRLATVFGSSPRMRFDLMVNDFVAKIATDRHIKIYEPHFKRNFIHIRDVCKAFRWFINDVRQRGVFNVGLTEANMTKWELANKIVECLKLEGATVATCQDKDPDQRNYLVSNKKVLKTGFVFNHTLDNGINEVFRMVQFLGHNGIAKMRNA